MLYPSTFAIGAEVTIEDVLRYFGKSLKEARRRYRIYGIYLEQVDMPEMRSFPVESHIVFYQVRSKQIEIIRVLHGRQDPDRHIINSRLGG